MSYYDNKKFYYKKKYSNDNNYSSSYNNNYSKPYNQTSQQYSSSNQAYKKSNYQQNSTQQTSNYKNNNYVSNSNTNSNKKPAYSSQKRTYTDWKKYNENKQNQNNTNTQKSKQYDNKKYSYQQKYQPSQNNNSSSYQKKQFYEKKSGTETTKKIKPNKEQVKGKFKMENFKWYKNSKTGVEYLKVCDFSSDIKNDAFKDYKPKVGQKINKLGTQVHAVIESYFKKNNKNVFDELIQYNFNQEQKRALQFVVQSTESYLKNRGFINLQCEKKLYYDCSYKVIDLLGYNQNEAVLIDWKFTSEKGSQIIQNEQFNHFYNQIEAAENHFKKEFNKEQYKVTIMVIPLKQIAKLKFVEYTKQQIIENQTGQEKKNRFRRQKIFYQRAKILKNLKVLKQQYLLDIIESKDEKKITEVQITTSSCLSEKDKIRNLISKYVNVKKMSVIKQARQIIESNDQSKINYFLDLDNSSKYRYTNHPTKDYNLPSRNLFDQFYAMHILIFDAKENKKSLINSTVKEYIDSLSDKFKEKINYSNLKIFQTNNQNKKALSHYNKHLYDEDFKYYYNQESEDSNSMSGSDDDDDQSSDSDCDDYEDDYYDEFLQDQYYYNNSSDEESDYGFKFNYDSDDDNEDSNIDSDYFEQNDSDIDIEEESSADEGYSYHNHDDSDDDQIGDSDDNEYDSYDNDDYDDDNDDNDDYDVFDYDD